MHRIEGLNADGSSGVNLFKTTPPYTTMTPEWANGVQEELMAAITGAGLPILSQNNDTKNQLLAAMQRMIQNYDYYVDSQVAFNAMFERTAANTYKIKSTYYSIFVKRITGGYSVASILSGGDTWGDIYTNGCEHLEFQNGAYINFAALKGNVTVDTTGCYLHNVDVRGNGGSGAIVESFKLGANHVTYDNCKCSNRLSSVDMVGFQGSGTALHNITGKYINCSVYSLDSADKLYGFKDCYNLQNCLAYDLNSSAGTDNCYGFYNSVSISNCKSYQLRASQNVYGFHTCTQVSSCLAEDILNTFTQYAIGFQTCSQISSCLAKNITGANEAYGFHTCTQVSSCQAIDIDSVNNGCGFENCDQISSCLATDVDSSGGSASGFASCTYGAAIFTDEGTNANNDWMDTVDAQITNKVSCPSVFT